MDYILTEASLVDLDDILNIEENAFISGTREDRDTYRQRLEVFPSGCILLKEKIKEHNTLGYLCGELWQTISPPYTSDMFTLGHSALDAHNPDGTTLYVSSMGILDSCRGKGLGKYLFNGGVERICTAHPQVRTVILLVNEDWEGARSIYTKAGFQETGRLEAFFSSTDGMPRTGIIMEKHV